MAVITSFMFKNALNSPGISPHSPPQSAEPIRHSHHGSFSTIAQNSAPNAPNVYCPATPILKSPVLNANATERPVIISGAPRDRVRPTPYGTS